MVVRMTSIESEVLKTVEAHLPSVGSIGLLTRSDLATILHSACTEAALAGWARGAESTQKRVAQEMDILRDELKRTQVELAYAQAN